MQELVFDPLQMKRTTFDTTIAMTYPLAQAHDLSKDKVLRVRHSFADNVAGYPAGFAMSTVLDLANFAIIQLNQGSFEDLQILSPDPLRLMHTIQADLYTVKGTGYGITFFTEQYKGMRLVWHDGGISSYVCKFMLVPVSSTRYSTKMGVFDFLMAVDGVVHTLEYGELRKFPRVIETSRQ